MSKKTRTTFLLNAVDSEDATNLYNKLKNNIEWEDGIRSKKGFTRKAKTIFSIDYYIKYPEIKECVDSVLSLFDEKYKVLGVYLNFYENGEMYTPNHTHPGTQQLVISLGSTRTLTINKKEFKMSNGSAILFGSSMHGVPKEPEVKDGRISIATFMHRIE